MADLGGSAVWGYGYVGVRTDTTQQTNTCLAIRLQTCVATFNPTCLSSIISAKGLLFRSLLIVGDVIVIWGTRLLMNGTYFYLRIVIFLQVSVIISVLTVKFKLYTNASKNFGWRHLLLFVYLVPKRRHISNKSCQIKFCPLHQ
jgi:hypothetical protein